MMRRIKRKEEEGAMGVGTLIVFIAMVLVAAVAASVLINTAKKLQQQAEKTGDQAIREVSSSFLVKDVFAYDGTDNEVETLVMKVGLAAGAPPQNLNQTVIQIQNTSAEANLIAASSQGTTPGSGNYAWTPIIEQDADEDQYLEQGDLVNITIDLTATLGGTGVGTQDDVSIHIIPKHGTPTYEEFTTPPVMTHRLIDL